MTVQNKVWLITGASRGMGKEIAIEALRLGYKVIATGRDPQKVLETLGVHENLLVVKLDITRREDAESALQKTLEKFGSIDVLVNNAANFYAGFFEEFSQEQIKSQMDTNFFGPLNVTQAILPQMRKQKSGHIITISSTAGLFGYEQCSIYSASKFAIEGWMDALSVEIRPFGIKTTIVNPGFFRTTLLDPSSTTWAENSIPDYEERQAELKANWLSMDGNQDGDPKKLAKALLEIANEETPPKRFLAGADAVTEGYRKSEELEAETDAYRDLSSSLSIEKK